jgi:hypothetical protein
MSIHSITEKTILVTASGKILDDDDSLSSAGVFEGKDPVICCTQVNGYENDTVSKRLSWCKETALKMQRDWSFVGDIIEECNLATESLSANFKKVIDGLMPSRQSVQNGKKTYCNVVRQGKADAELNRFSFDTFLQEFPPETVLEEQDPEELILTKGQPQFSTNANSDCPSFAQKVIELLIEKLNKTNINLANNAAGRFESLLYPMSNLADKRPLLHDHHQAFNRFIHVEKSLNQYRLIMEMETYCEPEDAETRKQAVPALQQVRFDIITKVRFIAKSTSLFFSV